MEIRYKPTVDNDLMQIVDGEEVGTLGVRLAPDTADLFARAPEMEIELAALRAQAKKDAARIDALVALNEQKDAQIAVLEARRRTVVCMGCGETLAHDTAQLDAAGLERCREHDRTCPAHPATLALAAARQRLHDAIEAGGLGWKTGEDAFDAALHIIRAEATRRHGMKDGGR
jgi:hypothetical protein